jgi:hypothetical protein
MSMFRASAILAVAVVCSACVAVSYPDPPSIEKLREAGSAPAHGRCVVTGKMTAGERAAFAEELRAMGLFDDVVAAPDDAASESADWVLSADLERSIAPGHLNCPGAMDLLNLLTLGIIPIVETRSAARDFTLMQKSSRDPREVHVDGEVTSIGGWLAAPFRLSPSFGSPHELQRRRIEARLVALQLRRMFAFDGAAPGR